MRKQDKLRYDNRESDYLKIVNYLDMGYSYAQIAKKLNIDNAGAYTYTAVQVFRLYNSIMAQSTRAYDADEERDIAVNQLDYVIMKAMEGWQNSLGDITTLTRQGKIDKDHVDVIRNLDPSDKSNALKYLSKNIYQIHSTMSTMGDSKFLQMIINATERKAKLLGLDKRDEESSQFQILLQQITIDDSNGATAKLLTSEKQVKSLDAAGDLVKEVDFLEIDDSDETES